MTEPPRRLRQGRHRHQARRLLLQLHHFRPVPDRAVGGHRTVARVNAMNKAVNLLGWLGSVAVAVSLFLRFQTAKPSGHRIRGMRPSPASCCILLYIATQWRDVAGYFERRQTRLGTIAAGSVVLVLGILVAVNYLASRRNHRWDLTAAQAVQPVGSDAADPREARCAGEGRWSSPSRRVRLVPRPAAASTSTSRTAS